MIDLYDRAYQADAELDGAHEENARLEARVAELEKAASSALDLLEAMGNPAPHNAVEARRLLRPVLGKVNPP